MNFMTLANLFVAWVLGCLITAVLWSREGSSRRDWLLILPLGAIVGLGASSALFFAASLISTRPALIAGVAEITICAALGLVLMRRPLRFSGNPAASPWSWLDWALLTAFTQIAVAALVLGWRAYRIEPYGGWDAWAIWNLHARFMYLGGTSWPQLLATPQLGWTHPDYPWLVSASVARVWAWSGTDSAVAGALVSAVFAVATVALLVFAVYAIRGRTPALVAGLLLVGTPFFVTFAPNQHADIPLAGYMLATLVLIALGRHVALAGVCAGLAAWTKNEGMLFAVVVAALLAVFQWRRGSRRPTVLFLGGLLAGGLPVICFKLALAPPGDLLGSPLGPRLAQIFDGARHHTILAALWRDFRLFGEWSPMPHLALALPFAAWRWRRKLSEAERVLPFALLLMMGGFYFVYLLTPQDLVWHLDSSLVRLLMQLWPIALLWWALAIPTQETVVAGALPRQRVTWTVFVAANFLAGYGVVGALSVQLAVNELAVRRSGANVVAVSVGEGWFGVERHGKERWAWSQGKAVLHVSSDASRASRPVTLKLELRSLSPRTVTIRQADRIVWEGRVGEGYAGLVLRDLVSTGGVVTLDFSTDQPGVAEPATAGARSLAYAVYNVKVE